MFSGTHNAVIWKVCGVGLLAMLGCVLCSRLSHPWTYNDDYNGAFWAQAARNFSRAGLLATAGVPAPLYFGPPPIPADALYVHHPTLLALLMYLDRAALGESEAAARGLAVMFSMMTAGLLWVSAARCAGWRFGAFALAFFAAAPMELHYGQMVNFEAPELFFMLAGLCAFHLWREKRTAGTAAVVVTCCLLAMMTDWPGYLLTGLLAAQLLVEGPRRNARMAAGLLAAAGVAGVAFLVQIRLAAPGAWSELLGAFKERSGHADLSGGTFTMREWARTEFEYLTGLFHPAAWILAGIGAVIASRRRRRLTAGEAAIAHAGAIFFAIDALYVCGLRNQSYIHDFAGFYFLAPIALFSAMAVEGMIRSLEENWGAVAGGLGTAAGCLTAGALIWNGIAKLNGIDTQFCILDDDQSEPEMLMPDVGRLIDQSFPADAVVICNFDPYYSPLPYYARHAMVNAVHDYAGWEEAVNDALPATAGGIIWEGAPDAPALLERLDNGEKREVKVDGVGFVIWKGPEKPEKTQRRAAGRLPRSGRKWGGKGLFELVGTRREGWSLGG